jgi:hypothetical protein
MKRQQIAEHPVLRAQLLVDGVREIGIDRGEQAQIGGVGNVEPREQQLFRNRKDGGVRPDCQRERDGHEKREPGTLAQQASGEYQVMRQQRAHPRNLSETESRDRLRRHATKRSPSNSHNHCVIWFQLAKIWVTRFNQ